MYTGSRLSTETGSYSALMQAATQQLHAGSYSALMQAGTQCLDGQRQILALVQPQNESTYAGRS